MRHDRQLLCRHADAFPLCSNVDVEFQAAEGDESSTPTFRILAYTGGKMRPVGFFRDVVIDLAMVRGHRTSRPILLNHDPTQIVGHSTEIEVSGSRIAIAGVVSGAGEAADSVVQSSRKGFPWKASVGGRFSGRLERVGENESVTVNGQNFRGPLIVVRGFELRETSFVAVAADDRTRTSVRGTLIGGSSMNFEAWLEARGFVADDLSDQQLETLRAAWQAETGEGTGDNAGQPIAGQPANVAATGQTQAGATGGTATDQINPSEIMASVRSQLAEEQQRVADINSIAAQYSVSRLTVDSQEVDFVAHAIAEGWTRDRAELHALRASRPTGPAVHSVDRGSMSNEVVEAALCMQAGMSVDGQFGEQTLEAANRYRQEGFRWLAERLCAAGGNQINAPRGSMEWIRAAFSSSELSGIVGNVANKALHSGFMAGVVVAPRIAATRSHTNFHAHTVYSLALDGELTTVGPDGEIKDLSMSEESYTRQVATRGAKLSISRQDLINDDLGAFAGLAMSLGRKAATSREKALFTALNATGSGASFFTTARGNYFEGGSTNLQASSLKTANQKFRDQTGPDGDPIDVEPKILLVPTAEEVTARELMSSESFVGPTSSKAPSRNVWRGSFEPLTSPWLSNANLTGYSSTAWYLLADPAVLAAIEIAYLNGMQAPMLEFFGMDNDPQVLGVTWRVYYDFGIALAEYRAGVKSKGAA